MSRFIAESSKTGPSREAGLSSTSTYCETVTADQEPARKKPRSAREPKSGPARESFPGVAHHLVSADAYKDAIFMQLHQQSPYNTNPQLLAHLKLGAQTRFNQLPVSSKGQQERLLTLANGQMVERTQEEMALHFYLEAHFSEVSKLPSEITPGTSAPDIATVEPLFTPVQQRIAVPESPLRNAAVNQSVPRSEFKPAQTAGAYEAVRHAFAEYTSTTFVALDTVGKTTNLPSVMHEKEGKPASKESNKNPLQGAPAEVDGTQQVALSNSSQWTAWKTSHNIVTVSNNPAGTNNCLLLSILQHASGRYHESAMHEHQEVAQALRTEMLDRKLGGIEVANHLSLEDAGVKWAIQKINAMYGRDLHVMTFYLNWTNGQGSNIAPVISTEIKGSEPVAIYGDGSHFEAVILTH